MRNSIIYISATILRSLWPHTFSLIQTDIYKYIFYRGDLLLMYFLRELQCKNINFGYAYTLAQKLPKSWYNFMYFECTNKNFKRH